MQIFLFKTILVLLVIPLKSYSPIYSDQSLMLADYFLKNGNYFDAITEYKRYIFFNLDNNSNAISYAFNKIGLSFREQSDWDNSIAALEKSVQFAPSHTIRDEYRIELALVYIAKGNFEEANFILLKVELFSESIIQKKRASLLRGISSIYAHNWKEATKAFNHYLPYLDENQRIQFSNSVLEALKSHKNFSYKSPKYAKSLSTIIPGSGQIYCGNWLNGINAFFINITLGYFLFSDLTVGNLTNAIFNYSFLLERFYQGNRSNAESAAINFNKKLDEDLEIRLLSIIEKNATLNFREK